MTKYIKLDDAIEAYNQAVTLLVESEMEEFNLGDFTECSFNTTQIKLIARMIESLPTIEVSEDAISREYLEEQLQQIEDITAMAHIDLGEDPYDETEEITMPISTVRKIFKNAPSVVPSRAEGKWIIVEYEYFTCDQCGGDVLSGAESTREARNMLENGGISKLLP